MSLQPYLYSLALVVPGIVAAALALYAWRRRGTPAAGPFAGIMATVALWSLAYAAELSSQDLNTQLLFTKIQYPGIAFLPVCWFVFALHYAGLKQELTPRRLAALCVVPCFTILMVWTNEAHHLFYQAVHPHVFGSLHTWSPDRGPAFWLNIVYSYLLTVAGLMHITRTFLHTGRRYQEQSRMILVAVLAPWITNMFTLLGYSPVRGLDLTPFGFTLTGLAVAWALFRLRLLDLVPIAREAVFEAISDGVVVVDERGRIVDLNAAAEHILDRTASAAVGTPVLDVLACWPRLVLDHQSPGDHRLKQRFGEGAGERCYELRLFSLQRRQLGPPSYLLLMSDITEQERAEEALRATEVSYHELFNAVGDAIYVQDREGRFLDINVGAELMYDYPREFFIGQTPEVLSAPDKNDLPRIQQMIEWAFAGEPQQFEFWGRRSNGEVFPKDVRLYKATYLGQDAIIALAVDITSRKAIEEAQRLAAVGQLAAGVAHEFNNLLAAMLLQAEMTEATNPHQAQELKSVVMRSARRGGATCADLMAYARPPQARRELVFVQSIIEKVLAVARRQLENAQITVERRYRVEEACVNGDAGQLEQVMLNLFINAADAMSGPEVPVGRRRLTVTIDRTLQPTPEVFVSIADTGTGIAPEHLPRVFEPFFTTKLGARSGTHQGAGLGLAVSHGIITAHEGRMDVTSATGLGTTFIVRLPALAEAPQAPRKSAATPVQVPPLPPMRVLLAEDEPDVRRLVVAALGRLGHTVTAAPTTQEAVAALASDTFDVVITDLMLPGAGGTTIIHCARQLADPPPTLVITGKLDPRLDEQMRALGAAGVLQKPFSFTGLLQALTEVMGEDA